MGGDFDKNIKKEWTWRPEQEDSIKEGLDVLICTPIPWIQYYQKQ
jgi:hypothetical protein